MKVARPLDYSRGEEELLSRRSVAGLPSLVLAIVAVLPFGTFYLVLLFSNVSGEAAFGFFIPGVLTLGLSGLLSAIAFIVSIASLAMHLRSPDRARFTFAYFAILVSLPGAVFIAWFAFR